MRRVARGFDKLTTSDAYGDLGLATLATTDERLI